MSTRDNKELTAAGVVRARHFQQLGQLLDISLARTRLLTASERRHSLDDVLDRFGFTRDDLETD